MKYLVGFAWLLLAIFVAWIVGDLLCRAPSQHYHQSDTYRVYVDCWNCSATTFVDIPRSVPKVDQRFACAYCGSVNRITDRFRGTTYKADGAHVITAGERPSDDPYVLSETLNINATGSQVGLPPN